MHFMRSRHIQRRQCDYVHELRGRHILRHDRRDGVHVVRYRNLLSCWCDSMQYLRERNVYRLDWDGNGVYSVSGGNVSRRCGDGRDGSRRALRLHGVRCRQVQR